MEDMEKIQKAISKTKEEHDKITRELKSTQDSLESSQKALQES